MVAKNDITGDAIQSRKNSKQFEDGHERIFGQRKTNGGWTPPPLPAQKGGDYAENNRTGIYPDSD